MEFIFNHLSNLILKSAFTVHNILGPGLLESAYEGAFCVELTKAGIFFERQKDFPSTTKGNVLGLILLTLL